MNRNQWRKMLDENKELVTESVKGALLNKIVEIQDDVSTYGGRIKNADKHLKNLENLERDLLNAKF